MYIGPIFLLNYHTFLPSKTIKVWIEQCFEIAIYFRISNIPHLMINNTLIEQVTEFSFLGLAVNELGLTHTKIANKIPRALGVMNRLKRYLPISAMKLMYDSLILSHLQFRITNWGFEWDRISKLQKRALRIMAKSRYKAHTEPLFKQLHVSKVKAIFDVQCLKFWYKFVNNDLPNYFRNRFTYNHELHDIENPKSRPTSLISNPHQF